MAAVPALSSCCSSPPSEAQSEHDHILPPGWMCKYVPTTKKYYFVPSEWMLLRDDALFCRLKHNFPAVDSNVIWNVMFRHKNVEHECISALLAHQRGSFHVFHSRSSPKMKLRYLQHIYPDVEENCLFDLLHNCDQNAQEAIERLESMGYRRVELDLSKAPPMPTSPTPAMRDADSFPPNVADKEKITLDLSNTFPNVDRKLIVSALECASYKQTTATTFLEAMTPQDSDKYFPKLPSTPSPPPIIRPCTGTQTKALIDSISGTPLKIKYFESSITTISHDVSTCTTLDGIIKPKQKVPLAKGPDPSLRKGPTPRSDLKLDLMIGPNPKLRSGPTGNFKGPVGPTVGKIAIRGADPSLRKGADCSLRAIKIVQEPKWDSD